MLRRISPQRLLIGGLILAIVLAAGRFFAVQGWIRPVRVVTGSMVERLVGEHFDVICDDCGFPFRYGVESPPPDERVVCPNCGYADKSPSHRERGRGDRVLIDRGAYWFDPIKRFDLVAFRDPRQPVRLVVKRVLGLPGERVAIRHGDLYLDEQLLRKSIPESRRSAILVHDQRYEPLSQRRLTPRWRADTSESGWSAKEAEFRFVPPKLASGDVTTDTADWLMYHHWRCYANPYPRSAEAPVADNYGYNQGESRELHEVVDLLLSCQVRLPASGRFGLRIHDGREWFLATVNARDRSVRATRGEQPFATGSWSEDVPVERLEIEFGLLDRQLVLAMNDREVLRQAYDPSDQPFQPISVPVGVGGFQDELQVSPLVLRRDVYYLDPWGVGQTWALPAAAGSHEYLVLGDNPPISDDSRKWKHPLLPGRSVLGRVIPFPR